MQKSPPIAVEITRGDAIESVHCGVAAVVDYEGNVIAHFGDLDYVTFSRSALKPFQALPTVMRGVTQRFTLDDRHVAVMCGSHSGEDCHAEAVRGILDAIGRTVDDFRCGVHVPIVVRNAEGPIPPKSEFTQLHNNCSGKHAGMLALAKMLECPPADYLAYDSEPQRLIRETIMELTGVSAGEIWHGIDGCSAPNYAMSIQSLAHGVSRLAHAATAGDDSGDALKRGARRIVGAMRQYPELVSGTGRFDLVLAQATRGRCVPKVGGEAIECIAVPERGWGIVAKVTDGNARALGPFVVSILDQLDLLDDRARFELASFARPDLRNHREIVIGTARPVVRLVKN
jgi:L-asparaginase II